MKQHILLFHQALGTAFSSAWPRWLIPARHRGVALDPLDKEERLYSFPICDIF